MTVTNDEPSQAPNSYRYDVFVSYADADAGWVFEWLLPRLKEAGLTVAVDEETFALGAPVLAETERAIEESRYTLAVLSEAWVQSNWDGFEGLLVQHADPGARLRKLIPLKLEADVDPPRRIQLLQWVDMTDPQRRQEQLRRVVKAIRGEAVLPELRPERALPSAWQRMWELRWLALIGVAAVLTLALVAWWYFSERGPTKMSGSFNIAVAQIGTMTANGSLRRSPLGETLSAWIFTDLQEQSARYEERGDLWHDSLPRSEKGVRLGMLTGETAEARANAARELAVNVNAHAVIYGHLTAEAPQQFVFEFYVHDRLGSESDLTIGRYQLGDPITIPANFDLGDAVASDALEKQVTERAKGLYWVLLAINKDLQGEHENALALLQQAQTLDDWDERGEGKETLYFFIGRQHLFLGRQHLLRARTQQSEESAAQAFAAADEALQTAEEYFLLALDRQPNFARAQIALAGVAFSRAQATPPKDRRSQPDLQNALDAYDTAVDLAQASNDRLLTHIARKGQADALMLRAETEYAHDEFAASIATREQASALLTEAIQSLEQAQMQHRLVAQAYLALGTLYMQQGQSFERMGESEDARSAFRQAAEEFESCLAQESNLYFDEYYQGTDERKGVKERCEAGKTATLDILAQMGGE